VLGFTDGRPIQNRRKTQQDVPAVTPLANKVSGALKDRGFKFVVPTMVYAWMQTLGLVNDYVVSCFRHAEVATLTAKHKTHP
jgi:DNA-3-methyladenine glycosylase I